MKGRGVGKGKVVSGGVLRSKRRKEQVLSVIRPSEAVVQGEQMTQSSPSRFKTVRDRPHSKVALIVRVYFVLVFFQISALGRPHLPHMKDLFQQIGMWCPSQLQSCVTKYRVILTVLPGQKGGSQEKKKREGERRKKKELCTSARL